MAHSSWLATLVISVAFFHVLVAGAPSPLTQQLINKEILNPAESVSEIDDNVEELHKLSSNTGNHGEVNATPLDSIRAAGGHQSNKVIDDENNEEPVDKGDTKRNGQPEKSELINEITSNRDTPRDMAEYIFWTGDEHGVTVAVKDFVDQGLMSEVEGITFLEEVRYDLHQMKMRFGDGLEPAEGNDKTRASKAQHYTVHDSDKEDQVDEIVIEIQTDAPPKVAAHSVPLVDKKAEQQQQVQQQHVDTERPHGEIIVSSFDATEAEQSKPVDSIAKETESSELMDEIKSKPAEIIKKDGGGEEHQVAELINNEYSLEEIIYQLARILFTQSLHQVGNPEAEEALKKFADFLEKESQDGKMSPQLQKKVLDVLLMSLFDAMGDHGNSSFSVSKLAADLEKTSTFPEKH